MSSISVQDLLKLFDDKECPQCQGNDPSKVKTTDFGDGSFVRTCSDCGWSTGVDDSVNMCDLGTNGWIFEPDDNGSCLDNGDHYPICIGLNKIGLMLSQCIRCQKQGIMYYDVNDMDPNALHDIISDAIRRMSEENLKSSQVLESGSVSEMSTEEEIEDDPMLTDSEINDKMVSADSDIVCYCGNNMKDFFELTCDSSGEPALKCFQCDRLFSCGIETACDSYVVCGKCDNKNEDFFNKTYNNCGKLVEVKCLNCDVVVKFELSEKVFHDSEYIHKERIDSWDQIERGNHISWQRVLSYEHHAVVTSVDSNNNSISVIEYGFNCDSIGGVLSLACVQERDEKIEKLKDIFLYRYDYDPEKCYAPEEVIERAKSRIGEQKFNVLLKNCEHFASWCKTGIEFCSQIIPMAKHAALTTMAFINQLAKPVMEVIKQQVFKKIAAGATVDDVINFTVQQLEGVKAITPAFNIGRIVGTVLLNLVIELAMFCHNYRKLKQEFDRGKIDKAELRKKTYQMVGESTGGLLLGLVLGFSWAWLGTGIAVTLLLNILGIIFGRLFGAWIGRKIHSWTAKK